MSSDIVGTDLDTRLLNLTARIVCLADLAVGVWEIAAENTCIYFRVGGGEDVDPRTNGRYCPRDAVRSFVVDESRNERLLIYWLPAGGSGWLRRVRPLESATRFNPSAR